MSKKLQMQFDRGVFSEEWMDESNIPMGFLGNNIAFKNIYM